MASTPTPNALPRPAATPAQPSVREAQAPQAVRLEGLSLRYGDRTALDEIRFDVAEGERFALLGPNGSGKSTLLRVLATLLRPSGGRAWVAGLDVTTQAALARRRLGVVFQAPSLDGRLSVLENLRFRGHLYGLRGRTLAERMEALLSRFGLAERRRDVAETLSGGLRRRVELAQALLHRPSVLLLDEPTTGLDLASQQAFWQALDELRGDGALTVVVATHMMDEAGRCERVALFDRGRLVALDTPAALKQGLGDTVLTLETGDPPRLVRLLRERLGLDGLVQDGQVRVRGTADAALAPRLMAQLGGEITALRLGRPTLGDVFLARTGRALAGESALGTAAPGTEPPGGGHA